MQLEEKRVFRQVGLPVSAFDVLKQLQRAWRLDTNAEVLTRLLLSAGRKILDQMKNGEGHDWTETLESLDRR